MDADAARALAKVLTEEITLVLDQPICSSILHGSLASGSYVSGQSDIDLLLVVSAPLSLEVKRAALEVVASGLPEEPVGLDLRVTTEAMAATPTRHPTIHLGIAAHAPSFVPAIEADDSTDDDLLIEFAVCRKHGLSLRGRDPANVIGPVPHRWLLEIADREIAQWQQLDSYAGSEIITTLTACRIWRYAEERLFCSKAEAASWTLRRAPECFVIQQAISAHLGESEPAAVSQGGIPVLLSRVRAAVQSALRSSSLK